MSQPQVTAARTGGGGNSPSNPTGRRADQTDADQTNADQTDADQTDTDQTDTSDEVVFSEVSDADLLAESAESAVRQADSCDRRTNRGDTLAPE